MQLAAARTYLQGHGSDALITFMAGQSVALDAAGDMSKAKARAVELGWLDPVTDQRTPLGFLVSDSCREYLFWQQRDKKLPFEDALPHLKRAVFDGKYLCEIGAGMGANLMSLASPQMRVCGVEPVDIYVQLGDIFRAREGMDTIQMRAGGAEALPFETDELDLVLLVSAHQYFDIHVALTEIARVLKPGGELILIGASFASYLRNNSRAAMTGKSDPKAFLITVINTLSYTALGRRVIPSRSGFSTSRPIYPSRAAMVRWMRAVGLEQLERPDAVGPETCYYARLTER